MAKLSETAFLQAILDRPDDDATRLVFADWLEEQGDTDRADFIRVQCELARLPADDRSGAGLRKREAALLKAHKKEWLAPFKGFIAKGEFRRGFVERVEIKCDRFLENPKALFSAVPVRDLKIISTLDEGGTSFQDLDLDYLADMAGLPKVARLDLSGHDMADDTVAELVRLTAFANLTALNLTGNEVEVGAMRALVKSPVLQKLEELSLGTLFSLTVGPIGSGVNDDSLNILANSPRLAQLTVLGLEDPDVGSDALVRLFRSRHAHRLHTLDLSSNRVTAEVLSALVETPERAARWCHLRLPVCQLNSAALHPLVDSPHLTGLETLDLRHNRITHVGARALAASPGLPALKRLELAGNAIPAPERQLLKDRFGTRVCRFT